MATSKAETVEEYLAELPEDRAESLAVVREVVVTNLPEGVEESMEYGMITYLIPVDRVPDGRAKKPLMFAALASQKNYMALYLHGVYADEDRVEQFRTDYKATGKRLDMGKSCVRFRKLDDLPLDLVATQIAATSVDEYIELALGPKSA